MKGLLFIDACPRGEGVSRTLRLAEGFLRALTEEAPDEPYIRHCLPSLGLAAVDGALLARREQLIDAGAFDDPLFALARDFQQAQSLVIAAPYWDLMFPAMLKVYIEHIFIRELTFRYRNDQPIGLCKAKRAVFFTTAGSSIGALDFGASYLRATLAMLGIHHFDCVSAEALDIAGADAQSIMEEAAARARKLAVNWQSTQ